MISSSYSWTKNITDAADITALGDTIENAYCLECERGNEEFTPRHRLLAQIAYQLPFGKGRPFLKIATPSCKESSADGPRRTTSFSLPAVGTLHVHRCSIFPIRTKHPAGRIGFVTVTCPVPNFPSQGFDVSCFVRPAAGIGRFGNSGVGIIEGPSQNGWSTNLFKYFLLRRKSQVTSSGELSKRAQPPAVWLGDSGVRRRLGAQHPILERGQSLLPTKDQAGDYGGNRSIIVGAKLEF